MQTLIIGDIHGCYDELKALIKKADLNSSDRIIALGDILDRGSDCLKVLQFFSSHAPISI